LAAVLLMLLPRWWRWRRETNGDQVTSRRSSALPGQPAN